MPIVCGTDFSQSSRAACRIAAALATRLTATEVWLVHVLDPSTGALGSAAEEVVKAAAHERLAQEAASLQQRTAARVHPAVLAGPLSETLLGFAEARKARLVIVASQGHTASPLHRVGERSERLAHFAQLPILVVRDAAPFEAWASGARPLRILLGVDWTRSCEAAIRWVKALRASSPCDVVVGYVYYSSFGDERTRRYGLPRQHSIVEPDPEAESLLTRDLAARVGDLGGRGAVVFRPRHGLGRFGDHLLELAESERVDLVVVGTHHKRGLGRLGSVSSVTLHDSRASVAVVPVPEGGILVANEVPSIRRVLVPTDLSALSSYAVPFGYTFFGAHGGEVYILHVLAGGKETISDTDVAAQLRSVAPKSGVPANVTTRTEVVRDANTSRAICQAAERLGVDAICIGSCGRSGFKRALLGSVAETVVRESRQPVFVVRPPPP